MALFNKFFTVRKNNTHFNKDNVSDKLFAFNTDQVRIILFRECDFRGRKLLFDSSAIKTIPIDNEQVQNEKFAEVSNGIGYLFTKPQSDFNQLAEMVFGSVAMSFRGTYFKIHNLSQPQRLMFTQVFPSPRNYSRRSGSVSSRNCQRTSTQSLEHSIKLDDSGASSTNSMSEQLSEHSTASDTVLVCRRLQSKPLDVPNISSMNSVPNPSIIIGDSGCAGQSFNSFCSGPPSLPLWEPEGITSTISLSSGSLYKRLLRSTSTSLDRSVSSLTGSGSVDEFSSGKPPHRSSKLGLALIIELSVDQEEKMIQFLMEHIALLQTMIWRTIHTVELAYNRPSIFVSLMMDIWKTSTTWLVNLLSGPLLVNNIWHMLSNGCDNLNSISAFSVKTNNDLLNRSTSYLFDVSNCDNSKSASCSSFNGISNFEKTKSEFNFFNISKFLKTEWDSLNNRKYFSSDDKAISSESFLKEFCEILEAVDVKDTNFFMSTLLTAVLTHHLGWVTTCLPQTLSPSELKSKYSPYNALWGQLSDLYGAIGYPTKMAQTIITGSNKNDIISKMLNCLTYFIRYTDLERRSLYRENIPEENQLVSEICKELACIPKENYKKYEDHLKEILPEASEAVEQENELLKPKFSKMVSYTSKVAELREASNKNDENDKFKTKQNNVEMKCIKNSRTPKKTFKHHLLENVSECNKIDKEIHLSSSYKKPELEMEKSYNINDNGKDCSCDTVDSGKVIFVLGDNEELVGIKKEKLMLHLEEDSLTDQITMKSKALRKRPSFLNLQQFNTPFEQKIDNQFDDVDFLQYSDSSTKIKPSTSWTALDTYAIERSKKVDLKPECSAVGLEKSFSRSQSVPPEDHKVDPNGSQVKSKYRYSGIKFNLQQYPQVVTNYMKSKNLEMANISWGEKSWKLGDASGICSTSNNFNLDFSQYESDSEEVEVLHTPSNASELEFTSDLCIELPKVEQAKESSSVISPKPNFIKKVAANTIVKECYGDSTCKKVSRKLSVTEKTECKEDVERRKMKIINLPMPKSSFYKEDDFQRISYPSSIMRPTVGDYIPDMVLQGTTLPKSDWEYKLKNDLALTSQHSLLDQPIEEAVAIVANTDTWEVQLVSSHTYVIDKGGTTGIRVGMSQLVASMLESLLQMWKLRVPPQHCLMHIEQKLQELCIRSKALAQLLLATEFCSMEVLTSALHLEVNDVPLLMAVASTHTPQVTQKYGLSFQ